MILYKEDFSIRLALLRTKMNISARDMSLSLGQNPGYINSIESGKSLPSMAMFFYICDYLHISPKEFFSEETISPLKIKKITEGLSCLDDDALDSIAVIVDKLSNKK